MDYPALGYMRQQPISHGFEYARHRQSAAPDHPPRTYEEDLGNKKRIIKITQGAGDEGLDLRGSVETLGNQIDIDQERYIEKRRLPSSGTFPARPRRPQMVYVNSQAFGRPGRRRRGLGLDYSDELDEYSPSDESSEELEGELDKHDPFDISFYPPRVGSVETDTNTGKGLPDDGHQIKQSSTFTHRIGHDKSRAYAEKCFHIIHSRYNEDGKSSGDITATLTTEQSSKHFKGNGTSPLRWIHLQSHVPSFLSFLETVAQLHDLSGVEQQDAFAILQQVRETCERPILTPKGVGGRYIAPTFAQSLIKDKNSSKAKRERPLSFLCFPYFCLAPYNDQKSSKISEPNAHPMRTLLQASYGPTTKQRDMQQAVRMVDDLPEESCLHVPQIWCLVLGDGVLITCARIPDVDLKRNLIDIEPPLSSPGTVKDSTLLLSDGGSRTWSLPLQDVATWLQFRANLMDLGEDWTMFYDVKHGDKIVRDDYWQTVVEMAQKEQVKLRLCRTIAIKQDRIPSPYSSPPRTQRHQKFKAIDDLELFPADGSTHSSANDRPLGAGELPATDHSRRQSNPPIRGSLDKFEAFLWISAIPGSAGLASEGSKLSFEAANSKDEQSPSDNSSLAFDVDARKMQQIFEIMERSIRSMKNDTSDAYERCGSRTLKEVELLIEEDSHQEGLPDRARTEEGIEIIDLDVQDHTSDDEQSSDRQTRYSANGLRPGSQLVLKLRVLKVAKSLFGFYLPLYHSCQMTEKYWGAVYCLIEDPNLFNKFCSDSNLIEYIDEKLRIEFLAMRKLSIELSGKSKPLPWNLKLPNQIGQAWMHLTLFFVLWASGSGTQAQGNRALDQHFELIYKGRTKLMQGLAKEPLRTREAALPQGILLLIIKKLSKDIMTGLPDVASTYHQYMTKLEYEVTLDPYNRAHQEKIANLRQEIDCVVKVFKQQCRCLSGLRSKLRSERTRLPIDDQREFLILQDTLSAIQERIRSFNQMAEISSNLAAFNLHRIESNRDRQEAAILIFTIITIVFLPLSFVASVFGMNSNDVRNMDKNQWLFWASAIPFTITVMLISGIVVWKIESVRGIWSKVLAIGSPKSDVGGMWNPSPAADVSPTTMLPPQRRPAHQMSWQEAKKYYY